MAKYRKIPAHRLPDLLDLKPDGSLFWKPRPGQKSWNTKHAGKRAFTARNIKGYLIGTIESCPVLAHRVVWAMTNGRWPDMEIDHIDGNIHNNHPDNLREVTSAVNSRNMARFSTNTSGFTGVRQHSDTKKWGASIKAGGKTIHLGYFRTSSEALAARRGAERVLGYHPNHGREKCKISTNAKNG